MTAALNFRVPSAIVSEYSRPNTTIASDRLYRQPESYFYRSIIFEVVKPETH